MDMDLHGWCSQVWAAWQSTPASVLAVMALGILAGSILKSITGFGSTIAHLCIWSVLRALGVNTGTLQQAIVTEVVFRTVTAIPYLRMTNAKHTANLKLVVSISLFQTLGSPVGAWLLLRLDQHILELCLAGALGLVLLGQAVSAVIQHLRHHHHSKGHPAATAHSDTDTSENTPSCRLSLSEPLLLTPDPALPPAHSYYTTASYAPPYAHPALSPPVNGHAAHTILSTDGQFQQWSVGQVLEPSGKAAWQPWSAAEAGTVGGESVLFLPRKSKVPSDSESESDSVSLSSDTSFLLELQGFRRTPGLLEGRGEAYQWAVLLVAGSVAGTLSGVMGGLTAIDGPPTIFMFNVLAADKAMVRGTNAVINCVLMAVLLVSYGLGGVFTWQDIPLYVTGSVFGWIGTEWGNTLSNKMSQQSFVQLLNLMVMVCAALMLASGLGVAGF